MSADLVVGGGGSVAVATDEMLEQAQALERMRDELDECLRRFAFWPLTVEADDRVTNHLVWARGAIEESARESGRLASSLRRASERYGLLERSLSFASQTVGAHAAYYAGLVLPGWVALHGAPVAFGLLAGFGLHYALNGPPKLTGTAPGVRAVAEWFSENPRVVNNPVVVALTRTAVSSVDDFGMGAVFAPPLVRQALGDEGLGIVGLPLVGTVLVGGSAGLGLLRATPVSVHRASAAQSVTAPTGFGDLASRIPTPGPGGAQMRIERYPQDAGGSRYLVYIGGTVDPSPVSTSEPWDVTSDVRTVVGSDSAAVRAAEQAMAAAGIREGDPVMVTGYSLGGIVARELAENSDFAVQGVFTLGAPVGQIPVPDGVAVVSVEHNEDLLAALGGHPLTAAEGGLDPLVVRRSLTDELDGRSDEIFAAHGLDDYRATAEFMDASEESRVVESRGRVTAFLGGSTAGVASQWRADRVAAD